MLNIEIQNPSHLRPPPRIIPRPQIVGRIMPPASGRPRRTESGTVIAPYAMILHHTFFPKNRVHFYLTPVRLTQAARTLYRARKMPAA